MRRHSMPRGGGELPSSGIVGERRRKNTFLLPTGSGGGGSKGT